MVRKLTRLNFYLTTRNNVTTTQNYFVIFEIVLTLTEITKSKPSYVENLQDKTDLLL